MIRFRFWNQIARRYQPPGMYALTGEDELLGRDERWDWDPNPTPLGKTVITVEQFTGLLDNTGAEIYDGDIVSFVVPGITHGPEREEWTGLQVWYNEEDACWAFGRWTGVKSETQESTYHWWFTMQDRLDKASLRKLGNIHENAELLTHALVSPAS